MQTSETKCEFKIGQRVHWIGDCRRIGTVKYVGEVEGYSGDWIGVDWDNCDGKHDGSINGVRYFNAQFPKSGSFARPHNLTTGVSLLQALDLRYRTSSTQQELGICVIYLRSIILYLIYFGIVAPVFCDVIILVLTATYSVYASPFYKTAQIGDVALFFMMTTSPF